MRPVDKGEDRTPRASRLVQEPAHCRALKDRFRGRENLLLLFTAWACNEPRLWRGLLPFPPPLPAGKGSESPSVVKGAGVGGLRP